MRLKRHRICVDDFELLTIIGRGAYGEVCIFQYLQACFSESFRQSIFCNPFQFNCICSINSWHLPNKHSMQTPILAAPVGCMQHFLDLLALKFLMVKVQLFVMLELLIPVGYNLICCSDRFNYAGINPLVIFMQ